MFEWWASLGIEMQVFYCIAIPATLIVIIQTILLMLGFGEGGSGVDASDTSGLCDGMHGAGDLSGDINGDVTINIGDVGSAEIGDAGDFIDGYHTEPYDGGNPADFGVAQLFTLQGIVTFLCVFGWSGVVCMSLKLHIAPAIIISLVLGFLAMFGVAKILQLSNKLTQNGNINMKNLLGQKATVYIPIPPECSGEGKVTVAVGEINKEFSAVTDSNVTIPTGKAVRIIDIRDDQVVVEIEN